MDIILITVLLTTGGLCLVAFLTWLGIRSYKSVKFEKRVESSLKHIERWIDDNNNEVIKKINDESIFVNGKLNTNTDDIYRTISEQYDNLNSKIDSRCDKLHDKMDNFKQDYLHIKKTIEDHYKKTDWLWKKIALNNNFLDVNEGEKVKE